MSTRGEDRKKKSLKARISSFLSTLLVIVGLIVISYPAIADSYNTYMQADLINNTNKKIDGYPQSEKDVLLQEAIEYNDNLNGDPVHDPFLTDSGYVIPANYWDVLNEDGNGMMGSISIPAIDVYLPIYHDSTDEVLQKGVGHLAQSSLPIGGEGRICVLTAHRGLPSASMFTNLDCLKKGDEVYIKVLGETRAWKVYDSKVVDPENVVDLTRQPGKDILALVTCTPYGINSHRLIVFCERCEYNPSNEQASRLDILHLDPRAYAFGFAIAIVIVMIIRAIYKKVKKNKKKKQEQTESKECQGTLG